MLKFIKKIINSPEKCKILTFSEKKNNNWKCKMGFLYRYDETLLVF